MFKTFFLKKHYCYILLFLFASCQQDPPISSPDKAAKPATKIDSRAFLPIDTTQQELGENLHYNDLKKYLPKIEGYKKKEEAKGQITRMSEFAYTQISQNYESKDGKKANVTIIDYQKAASLFGMAVAFMKVDFFTENEEELMQKVDLGLQNVIASEHIQKKDKETILTIATGERFLITIQLNDEINAEKARTIAKQMPLKEMVALTTKVSY